MRNGKSKMAVIIICCLVCTIGILYYITKCNNEVKEAGASITKAANIKECTTKKEYIYERLRKNINEVEDVDSLLYTFDESKFLVFTHKQIVLKDTVKKTSKVVKTFNTDVEITSSEGSCDYAAWIETSQIKEGYHNIKASALYIYDVKKDIITKIDESTYTKNANNSYSNNYDLGLNFKIKGDKFFYLCYEYNGTKLKDQFIKEYDMKNKSKNILYKQTFKKKCSYFYLYNFDIDYEKHYLACCIKYYGDLKGYALMAYDTRKADSSKLLAVSEKEIVPTIIYPNMCFQVGNDIHLYNIEKKGDDFVYESKNNISGVKMTNGIIAWDSDKIYCYDLQDKKIYGVNDDEYSGKSYIKGNALYWDTFKRVRYIDIN